jgi:hypothetical protein
MKSVRERMDMTSAFREVGSYRGAAQICGTTHRTVKKAVLAAERAEAGLEVPVVHNYDLVRDIVVERVARTKGKISAKRLLPIVRADGYEGSARNLRRLVAEVKTEWKTENHRGRRPGVWTPGDMHPVLVADITKSYVDNGKIGSHDKQASSEGRRHLWILGRTAPPVPDYSISKVARGGFGHRGGASG